MLTVAEALAAVLAEVVATEPVRVPLSAAVGLALAEDIASDVDSPPHDKATVDGYAVCAADLVSGTAELVLLEEVVAGDVPRLPVAPGQTTRVMTGAPIPGGADAMVMIERSQLLPATGGVEGVRLTQDNVRPGQNIVRRAAVMHRGDVVLRRQARVGPSQLGLLAEVGRDQVLVHRRPTLAVLATGNELVDAATRPGAGQIRNSCGPMLVALAQRAGASAVDLGIALDEPEALAERIRRGLESDVLVISGGVSAGVLDLVPAALRGAEVEPVFHKVDIKPGKPLWFGRRTAAGRRTLVFGLPGNPVSSLVCFELFVRPALAGVAGGVPHGLPVIPARLACDFQHRSDRPTYHPGRWANSDPSTLVPATSLAGPASMRLPEVMPLAWQGSGDLRTLAQANALIQLPAGQLNFTRGDLIDILIGD